MKQVEVAVLAGGRGTRMRNGPRPEFRQIPKIFIPISFRRQNESLFFHVLTGITSQSPGAISILAGRHPECGPDYIIKETSRLAGSRNMAVFYDPANTPLGTAGALYQAASRTRLPIIVAVPADTLFPVEKLSSAVSSHVANKSEVTWVVTSDPGESAQNVGRLLIQNSTSRLLLSGEDPYASAVSALHIGPGTSAVTSAGVVIFRAAFYQRCFLDLMRLLPAGPLDIYRDVMSFLLRGFHRVDVFDIGEAAPDLGTPERFLQFEQTQLLEG